MMRKVYFAITALLALAVFSCDFIPNAPASEPVTYTEDGRELVTLTIGVPNKSKALTAALAQAGTNFYEVAFTDGTNIYRHSWDWTQTGKIQVPTNINYAGADKAVLFAGRYSDMTLLAIGRITGITTDGASTTVNYAGTPDATVTLTTTSVTFTLAPLLTNVNGNESEAAVVNSSFLITGPAAVVSPPAPAPVQSYITTIVYASKKLPTAKLTSGGTKNIPIFLIPAANTGASATFGLSVGNTLATAVDFDDYNIGTKVLAGSKIRFAGVSSTSPSTLANFAPVLLNSTTTVFGAGLATGSALPASIPMTLIAADPNAIGLCTIAIEVPVAALDATASTSPLTWYVRGGLQNARFDEGPTATPVANAQGGAILIGVGNLPADITIGTDWMTP